MLPRVYSALRESAEVLALIGSPPRVYRHGSAPFNVIRPYVTWSAGGGDAENSLDGADADTFRIRVDVWSDDEAQVETLARAVRDAIETRALLQGYYADDRDAETGRYRIGMSFDWIEAR